MVKWCDDAPVYGAVDRITLDLDKRTLSWINRVLLPRLRRDDNVLPVLYYRRSSSKGWHVVVQLKQAVTQRRAYALRRKWFDDRVRIRYDKARARGSCPHCAATGHLWDEKNGRTAGRWRTAWVSESIRLTVSALPSG